jgi:hypothetical protein
MSAAERGGWYDAKGLDASADIAVIARAIAADMTEIFLDDMSSSLSLRQQCPARMVCKRRLYFWRRRPAIEENSKNRQAFP